MAKQSQTRIEKRLYDLQKRSYDPKILIVKPSSLGDVVHSLPFLSVIKTCFPQAEVHWVIARGLHELLDGHPMLEKLWIIDKDQWKKLSNADSTIREIKTLYTALKKEKFDIAVDLQGLLRSGLITMATGAKTRMGFKEAREGSRVFYTHKVEGGKGLHAVDRYLKIAAALGCDIPDIDFPLQIPDRVSLPVPGDYAVLVPSARWKTKRWPAERFGELASLLPFKSVVIGAAADIELANRVVEHSGGNAVSLTGKTGLKDLTGIIKNARFMVSNDSGPMHIAAALSVPVVAIFGPTSPLLTGPYERQHMTHKIIKENVSCAPCFKRNCKDIKCMDGITVKRVLDALNDSVIS